MKKLFDIGIFLMGVGLFVNPVLVAAQEDHAIFIENDRVITNNALLFNYENVGPGFNQVTPLHIYNYTDGVVGLRFNSYVVDTANDPNTLFPFVRLTLRDEATTSGNAVAISAVGDTDIDLINNVLCVPAESSTVLFSRMRYPSTNDNDTQHTSLQVEYELEVSVGVCGDNALELIDTGRALPTAIPTPRPTPTPTPTPSPTPSPGTSGSSGGSSSSGSSSGGSSDSGSSSSQSPTQAHVLPPAGESLGTFYFLVGVVTAGLIILTVLSLVFFFLKKNKKKIQKQSATRQF